VSGCHGGRVVPLGLHHMVVVQWNIFMNDELTESAICIGARPSLLTFSVIALR